MGTSGHIRLFVVATLVWAGFWLAGLPSYYQQYSTVLMAWFDAALCLALVGLVWRVLRRVPRKRRTVLSLWIAFYFTVPLMAFDGLYCGIYLGHGVDFLWHFWYLTIYYFVPWILLPGTAMILNRARGTPTPG